MKTFDLTEHLLKRHECDFFRYYFENAPANDDNNVIIVNFGGR